MQEEEEEEEEEEEREEGEEDCQLYAYGAEHVARRARGAQNTWLAENDYRASSRRLR